MQSKSKDAARQKTRGELRHIGNDLLNAVSDEIDSLVVLVDVGRLGRFVTAIHNHLDAELMQTLRAKGLDADIRALCDKAGAIKDVAGTSKPEPFTINARVLIAKEAIAEQQNQIKRMTKSRLTDQNFAIGCTPVLDFILTGDPDKIYAPELRKAVIQRLRGGDGK